MVTQPASDAHPAAPGSYAGIEPTLGIAIGAFISGVSPSIGLAERDVIEILSRKNPDIVDAMEDVIRRSGLSWNQAKSSR